MKVHDTLESHNRAAHRAIQRMLERMLEVARQDPSHRSFPDGIRCAVTMLRAHHGYEDELLLPLLARKEASGPWERIAQEHEELDAMCERLEAAAPAERADLLRGIHELVVPHMEAEEAELGADRWAELLDEDEARAFGKQVSHHSREHLKPSTKLLPLILYNLNEEERAEFTEPMPDFVVNGLAPWAFRPMWRGLRPFMTFAPKSLFGR